jgi:hypothetical protein
VNLEELITQFRAQSLDEGQAVLCSDELLTVYANEAQTEACRRGQLLVDAMTVAVEAGAEFAAFEARMIQVLRAFADGQPLGVATADEMDLLHPGWQFHPASDRPRLLVSGVVTGKLALWPRPAGGCTVRLTAQCLPRKTMANDTDKPEIRPELHSALVDWMLYRSFARQDPDMENDRKAAAYLAKFEAEFGRKVSGRNEAWVRSGGGQMPGPIC